MEQRTQMQRSGEAYGSSWRARWQSRVLCLTAVTQFALAKKINDFYAEGRFIVGTQVFQTQDDEERWTGFVYYKVRS
jgi:hypothetical protein